jgi:DNA polymerase III alpha subunit
MTNRLVDAWGRVALDPQRAFELAYQGFEVWAIPTLPDPIIDDFNALVTRFDKEEFQMEFLSEPTNTPEEEHARRASTWLISDDIKTIPVREFLISLCKRGDEIERVNHEMDLFEARDLVPLLQLMMYLVDHFRRNKIVWGVGRGSSVASYCLFLIGVHKIDSIKYGLSVNEFLKD